MGGLGYQVYFKRMVRAKIFNSVYSVSMKKRFLQFLPDRNILYQYRWLRPFASILGHPALWRLNGHGVAGGVAVGLACGLIPGPFQMPSAVIICLVLRVNLPVALVSTFYTNPLTIVPIYLAAYGLGCWLMGVPPIQGSVPPEWGEEAFSVWVQALGQWIVDLGAPLVLGLGVFIIVFPVVGYLVVRVAWRIWLIQRWKRRRNRFSQR